MSSKSIELAKEVINLKNKGKDIISWHIGEIKSPVHKAIKQSTIEALEQGHTNYSLVPGEQKLREEIISFHQSEYKQELGTSNVFVSNGSKQILYQLFQCLLSPGDEVLVPRPYWLSYPESIKLASGIPVFIDDDNFDLNLKHIERSISKATKGIVINMPNNPSGKIFSENKIKDLIKLCKKNSIWLICDEAYEQFVYQAEGIAHPHSFHDSFDPIISVKTFSKSFCMTGFRIGYAIASEEVCQKLALVQSHVSGNSCTFAQYGAEAALQINDDYLATQKKNLKKKRDLAFSYCSKIFETQVPDGGFFLFPSISSHLNTLKKHNIKSCEDLAFFILQKAHVALLPGAYFCKENHLRISFTGSDKDIERGFERLEKVLRKIL